MFKLNKKVKTERDFSKPGTFLGCVFKYGDDRGNDYKWTILEYIGSSDRYYRSKISSQDPTMGEVETAHTYYHSDIRLLIDRGTWVFTKEIRDV
jgi:hypothetical protein